MKKKENNVNHLYCAYICNEIISDTARRPPSPSTNNLTETTTDITALPETFQLKNKS